MPFQSEQQRKYLWKKEPDIAKRWTEKYGPQIASKSSNGRVGDRSKSEVPKQNVPVRRGPVVKQEGPVKRGPVEKQDYSGIAKRVLAKRMRGMKGGEYGGKNQAPGRS